MQTLLARHRPILVYDSQEAYFADAAAIWTDSPFNVLKRADGSVLAKPPTLSLGLLDAHTYGNGKPVLAGDTIGETTKDYAQHAKAMHAKAGYPNIIYGRVAKDSKGATWIQYWFFYYYNHFTLAGPFSGGDHEGDWEMIQIRLNASEQPEQAVYAQHKSAESRAWAKVKTNGTQPYVYSARGSHASYFESGPHFTGTWWDQNDAKGGQIAPAVTALDPQPKWVGWPGAWGDTKATISPLDSSSPVGPAQHAQWGDPLRLVATAARAAAAPAAAKPLLPAPTFTATRSGDTVKIAFTTPAKPQTVVVGVRDTSKDDPATQHVFAVDQTTGEVEVPAPAGTAHDVTVSAITPDGNATPTGLERIGPA